MGSLKKTKDPNREHEQVWSPVTVLKQTNLGSDPDYGERTYSSEISEDFNDENCDPSALSQPKSGKSTQFSSKVAQETSDCGSSNSDKKKVAPRSGLQFKVGPSFDSTTLYMPIHVESTDENVFPFVNARIDRGFDYINGEWIGYKRNYFTLVAAFEFENKGIDIFSNEKFYTYDNNDRQVNIKCFALRLVSKCCEDDMQITLVQHTAKRDRGPQFSPPVYPAVSGTLPSHQVIKSAANIRNLCKIDQFNKLFFLDISKLDIMEDCILQSYPTDNISTVARYERIQFSTSINHRKPTMVNRHFVLQVELLGLLKDEEYVVLASTETPPLIVRGRSPSNYQIAKMNAKALLLKQKLDPLLTLDASDNYVFGNIGSQLDEDEDTDIKYKKIKYKSLEKLKSKSIIPIERRTNRIAAFNEAITMDSLEEKPKKKKRGRKKSLKVKTTEKRSKTKNRSMEPFQIKPDNNKHNLNSNEISDKLQPADIASDSCNVADLIEYEKEVQYCSQPEVERPLGFFPLEADYNIGGFMEPAVIVKKHKSKSRKSSTHKHKKRKLKVHSEYSNIHDSFLEYQHGARSYQSELRCNYSQPSLISEYFV